MWEILFWASISAIIYSYTGYPLLMSCLARLRRQGVHKSAITPSVSVVIACHNEAPEIEQRIRNLLQSDYPADLLEIIIVSDGSSDSTAEVARRFAGRRVRVFAYESRMGKAVALNIGVTMAGGEIVVFADARQRFEPQAIRRMVANFADAGVGVVSGELLLQSGDGGGAGENVAEGIAESLGLYWKYEKWIRKNESRTGSVIGATGAIYAIRRALWEPLPPRTILDDVYTPMRIAMLGYRVVFEQSARAYDKATDSPRREFARKVRTLTGNYQLCQLMPRLLLPTSVLVFQFYSHKLMRLVAPIFFVLLLIANAAIIVCSQGPAFLYGAALVGQVCFYASVGAGAYLLKRDRQVRVFNFAYVFSVMNAAALVSLLYFIAGKRDVWIR